MGMVRNRGSKFVRVTSTGCVTAWVDIKRAQPELVCCRAGSTERLCRVRLAKLM